MGSHSLLQRLFLTQGSNLGLPHCRQILYCLGHQGSPSLSYGTGNLPSSILGGLQQYPAGRLHGTSAMHAHPSCLQRPWERRDVLHRLASLLLPNKHNRCHHDSSTTAEWGLTGKRLWEGEGMGRGLSAGLKTCSFTSGLLWI